MGVNQDQNHEFNLEQNTKDKEDSDGFAGEYFCVVLQSAIHNSFPSHPSIQQKINSLVIVSGSGEHDITVVKKNKHKKKKKSSQGTFLQITRY